MFTLKKIVLIDDRVLYKLLFSFSLTVSMIIVHLFLKLTEVKTGTPRKRDERKNFGNPTRGKKNGRTEE